MFNRMVDEPDEATLGRVFHALADTTRRRIIERLREADALRIGDIAAAFESAHVIVDGTYELPYQEHAFLQTEAGLAYLDVVGRGIMETWGLSAAEVAEYLVTRQGNVGQVDQQQLQKLLERSQQESRNPRT